MLSMTNCSYPAFFYLVKFIYVYGIHPVGSYTISATSSLSHTITIYWVVNPRLLVVRPASLMFHSAYFVGFTQVFFWVQPSCVPTFLVSIHSLCFLYPAPGWQFPHSAGRETTQRHEVHSHSCGRAVPRSSWLV